MRLGPDVLRAASTAASASARRRFLGRCLHGKRSFSGGSGFHARHHGSTAQAGRWQQALQVLENIRSERGEEPDLAACTKVMASCGRGRRWDAAIALFDELRFIHGRQPDEVMCTAVLSACRHAAAWAPALAVLAETETGTLGFLPGLPHYGAAAGCCEHASWLFYNVSMCVCVCG
ncbi:unnamed protein product [Polarella glacialis]|uniref:Uncharacterized protein n=1 Tax=Polarella glacialis TaxID=89957 RepID=A0A813DKH8_POLGL|nr:unnamed protein product [Polarella glacialis]